MRLFIFLTTLLALISYVAAEATTPPSSSVPTDMMTTESPQSPSIPTVPTSTFSPTSTYPPSSCLPTSESYVPTCNLDLSFNDTYYGIEWNNTSCHYECQPHRCQTSQNCNQACTYGCQSQLVTVNTTTGLTSVCVEICRPQPTPTTTAPTSIPTSLPINPYQSRASLITNVGAYASFTSINIPYGSNDRSISFWIHPDRMDMEQVFFSMNQRQGQPGVCDGRDLSMGYYNTTSPTSCGLIHGSYVYEGCGLRVFQSHDDCVSQCGSINQCGALILIQPDYPSPWNSCHMRTGDDIGVGCGYAYVKPINQREQCGFGGNMKWVAASTNTVAQNRTTGFYARTCQNGYVEGPTSVPVLPGQWYHITFLFKNRTAQLYVNGVAGIAREWSAALSTSSEMAILGGRYDFAVRNGVGISYPWYGRIGSMNFYNFVMVPIAIRNDMIDGSIPTPTLSLGVITATTYGAKIFGTPLIVTLNGAQIDMPTTPAPTTVAPTTRASTTQVPTTATPATVAPTTSTPTTAAPLNGTCGIRRGDLVWTGYAAHIFQTKLDCEIVTNGTSEACQAIPFIPHGNVTHYDSCGLQTGDKGGIGCWFAYARYEDYLQQCNNGGGAGTWVGAGDGPAIKAKLSASCGTRRGDFVWTGYGVHVFQTKIDCEIVTNGTSERCQATPFIPHGDSSCGLITGDRAGIGCWVAYAKYEDYVQQCNNGGGAATWVTQGDGPVIKAKLFPTTVAPTTRVPTTLIPTTQAPPTTSPPLNGTCGIRRGDLVWTGYAAHIFQTKLDCEIVTNGTSERCQATPFIPHGNVTHYDSCGLQTGDKGGIGCWFAYARYQDYLQQCNKGGGAGTWVSAGDGPLIKAKLFPITTRPPTTQAPTTRPTQASTTSAPTTPVPTRAPTTQIPTQAPTTQVPTQVPTTQVPTTPTTPIPVPTTFTWLSPKERNWTHPFTSTISFVYQNPPPNVPLYVRVQDRTTLITTGTTASSITVEVDVKLKGNHQLTSMIVEILRDAPDGQLIAADHIYTQVVTRSTFSALPIPDPILNAMANSQDAAVSAQPCSSSSNTGAIVGGVVAAMSVLLILSNIVTHVITKRQQQKIQSAPAPVIENWQVNPAISTEGVVVVV